MSRVMKEAFPEQITVSRFLGSLALTLFSFRLTTATMTQQAYC